MAITIKGVRTAGGSVDSQYIREYERVYRVHSTDKVHEDEFAVLSAMASAGYAVNARHPTDPRATILKVAATVVSAFNDGPTHGLVWDVTVSYGPWNPLQHSTDGDPLNKPVTYRLDPVTVEQVLTQDVDGNPIVNTAGDPFDPPLTEEVTQYLLTFQRNEVDVDVAQLMLVSGKGQVNKFPWNGFPAMTVKILPIKLPERLWSQESQTLYFPMEYCFHVNFDKWTRKVLNQGFGELYTSGGVTKRRSIVDSSGQPLTTPVPLDSSGHQIPQPIDHTDILFREFEVNEGIEFSVFNLDGVL